MSKKLKFALITAWIVLSRSYDAYCTYQLTPDLSKEANPLVSVLGFSWGPLLLVIGLLCLYVIYAYYVSVFKPMNLLPEEEGWNFREVSTFIYLGKRDRWLAMLYKYPKQLRRLNQVIGHTMTQCVVFAGIVSTLMWLLINYTEYYHQWHSPALIYSIIVIGCFVLFYHWFVVMYRNYQKQARPSLL